MTIKFANQKKKKNNFNLEIKLDQALIKLQVMNFYFLGNNSSSWATPKAATATTAADFSK
jgi:hypothetical protein